LPLDEVTVEKAADQRAVGVVGSAVRTEPGGLPFDLVSRAANVGEIANG
jgi:hypothetical protein